MHVKLPKAEQAGLGRVGTAGRAMKISQGRRRKGLYGVGRPTTYRRTDNTIAGPTKARIRFGGIKIVQRIRKPWEGKREVSVGLVRRRETLRRPKRGTDIWGISKAVVGRAVLSDFDIGRRRHTEVRSSYHFRVRAKNEEAKNSDCITGSSNEDTTRKGTLRSTVIK
ncbi:hypothetical protein BY996DRAFT_6561992 [Phakopsora pachyrhizi]|nr:hypothetical protein BY996DRAFT_6561992 [Phakopsora pachyrhizi]